MGTSGSTLSRSAGQRRTAVGVATALTGGVLVLFVGVAGAHHPEITATATAGACQGIGGIQIDVTVRSFVQRPDPTSDGRDINAAIQVYASTESRTGTYSPQGAPGAVDHDTSFSRSFTVPSGTTVVWLVAEAQVPWGDGAAPRDVIDGAGNLITDELDDAQIFELVVPDIALPICEASITGECVDFDGIATLELSHGSGSGPVVDFGWSLADVDGAVVGSGLASVAAGDTATEMVTGLLDGVAYTATVTADGVAVAVAGSPLTIDFSGFESCRSVRSAAITGECVDFDGIATLELANGSGPVVIEFEWTLAGPGVFMTKSEADVAAGEIRTIEVTGLLDGETYTTTAAADGEAVPVEGSPLTIDFTDFPSCVEELVAGIDIEKLTNGQQADLPGDAVRLEQDAGVTWTYIVTNTGDLDLVDVVVDDDIEGFICELERLQVGAAATCALTGTAQAGLYSNTGTASGCPVGVAVEECVTDTDPSHYVVGPPPGIDIEVLTNGEPADRPDEAVLVQVGSPVEWTYLVTNTGQLDLVGVEVTDAIEGFVCLIPDLAVDEQVTCRLSGTAQAGLYVATGRAEGCPVDDEGDRARAPDGSLVDCPTDQDLSHYDAAEVLGKIAFTGSDSADLARVAGWLLILGGFVTALVGRRDDRLVTS